MNILHRVTLQTLKKNRVRTAVTVVGIVLSAAMITAVTVFADSLRHYAVDDCIYTEGNWHGAALGEKYGTYGKIESRNEVEQSAFFQQLGYAKAEGCQNEFKPYLYVLGAGENAGELLSFHITEGRFPKSANEILLPNHLYENGGVEHSIGDRLTLALGRRVLGEDILTQDSPCYITTNGKSEWNGEELRTDETRVYTVCGFYERLGNSVENYTAPGYTAFTLADGKPSNKYRYDIYFRLKHSDNIYGFMRENGLNGKTNGDLLRVSGVIRNDNFSSMLTGLCAIVIALIMFGAIALIYNAFSISVSERTRQFGMLSSVGATRRQLRRAVFFEAFAVSAAGIPAGILAGIGGIWVTLLAVGDKFRSAGFGHVKLRLYVSPVSVIAAAAVSLVTVLISAWVPSKRASKISAVDAIRQTSDISAKDKAGKTPKLTYRIFGLPGVLASKYYRRSKKKYRATVLSLFMSIVLFVSVSAFGSYLTDAAEVSFGGIGYDLECFIEGNDFGSITPDELLRRIKSEKTVNGAEYSVDHFIEKAIFGEDCLTEMGKSFFTDPDQPADSGGLVFSTQDVRAVFVNDDAFRSLLKEYGLSEEEYMNASKPLGIALDGISRYDGQSGRYVVDGFFREDGFEIDCRGKKEIPGYYFYGVSDDGAGNTVYTYVKQYTELKDGQTLELTESQAVETYRLRVGKTISEIPNFVSNNDFYITVIYPLRCAGAAFPDFTEDTDHGYNFVVQAENHAECRTALKQLFDANGFDGNSIIDYAERTESEKSMITILRVFSYGFVVLISLIATANVFNTITTNIALRRREFAMLKSVGMTGGGFDRMMIYECLLYGSRSLIFGIPVSFIVTFLIYLSVSNGVETAFRLPWGAVGIAALSVFLVVFASMMYAVRKVKKDNPIDALKNENM